MFDSVFMKDAEYVETNEKSYFRFFLFLFFELWWKCIENWPYFEYKNDHNSKNENRKHYLFLTHYRTFRIFHVNLNTFEKKKNWIFFYLICYAFSRTYQKFEEKKIGGRLRPPHYTPGLRPWTPHALRLRTLVGTG